MGAKLENAVACQEVAHILEHVQQAITEHKNMLETAEMYLERNGLKQEYAEYLESRLAERKTRKEDRNIAKVAKTEQETVKKVKRSRAR